MQNLESQLLTMTIERDVLVSRTEELKQIIVDAQNHKHMVNYLDVHKCLQAGSSFSFNYSFNCQKNWQKGCDLY